ncbi:MAG: tetratricopeptide repeat protein [Nitritalea sp.]
MKTSSMPLFLAFAMLFVVGCTSPSEKQDNSPFILPADGNYMQGIGFLGDTLFTDFSSERQAAETERLQEALRAFERTQEVEEGIWVGRRLAYLGLHREAIDAYSALLDKAPRNPEVLRHRGHRYISLRELEAAIRDFSLAAQYMEGMPLKVEEDGLPNAQNIPLSTLQFNVWYHLGLAHYLAGDFESARQAYQRCLEVCENDDSVVATLDWYYMTLHRLGLAEEAEALLASFDLENAEIIENDAYFQRLKLYSGHLQPEELLDLEQNPDTQEARLGFVTQGYGLGRFYMRRGQPEAARNVFKRVLSTGYWAAFGYIASEKALADLEEHEQSGI